MPVSPMTASGRAPPVGKFPVVKQQGQQIQVPRVMQPSSSLGNESVPIVNGGGDEYGGNVSINSLVNSSGGGNVKIGITTSSVMQDDEYGSTLNANAPAVPPQINGAGVPHMPMKQPPYGMNMTGSNNAAAAAANGMVDVSPRKVTPGFKAPSIHKNPLANSNQPIDIDSPTSSMSMTSSPMPQSAIPPQSPAMSAAATLSLSSSQAPQTAAAVQQQQQPNIMLSGSQENIPTATPVTSSVQSGEETLSVLRKKGSVVGYNTEQQQRKVKQKVKPTAYINVPKYIAEKPISGLYSLNAVDRSEWRARVLTNNPNIADFCERIYPLERGISFCKLFHPGQRAVKEEMKQTQVIQLILQHLQLKGFNATRRVLEKESHIQTPRHRLHTSRLTSFIHSAIRDTDTVYDYVMGEKIDYNKQIEDKIWQMGLQEEEEENEDVDIWQEPADRVRYDVDGDPKSNVKCGSFNKLVELLTGEYSVNHQEYYPAFLLTYQSFSTPEKLLQKLVQRFNVPQQSSSSGQGQQAQLNPAIIRGRVCNIMRKWIEEFPSDFDAKLNLQMKQFLDYAASTPATAKTVATVSNSFQKMLAENKAQKKTQRGVEPPEPIIPMNFFSKRWDEWHPMELDEEEIARQLSLMDWEYFSKIKPTELLNQAWSKPKLKHRAPNVLAFIAQFNRTSTWAATEILSAPNIRERVKVVTKLIKISEKLTQMNNFNSLMSISAALNCSSVSRLKHTFAELPPNAAKGKKDIDELVTSDGNFKILRQRIADINPATTPCIPYLGYVLSDLTFTDENPDKIQGMINFNKRVMVYRIINGILSRQTTPFNFQPVQQIVRILRKVPLKSENELYDLSLKHEPRGAQRNTIK